MLKARGIHQKMSLGKKLKKLIKPSRNGGGSSYDATDTEHSYWVRTRKEVAQESDLENFKNWAVIRRIPLYGVTDHVEHYSREVLAYLKQFPQEKRERWVTLLREPKRGHSEVSYRSATIVSGELLGCTNWTLKSAHHVLTFEELMGKSILHYDQIVEFGAGIGETARLIRDMGFSGTYFIYDLPEIARISDFYLAGWARQVSHFEQVPRSPNTLFIATWSLSEVPFNYRDEILTHFRGSDFLLTFQNDHAEYHNQPYFISRFPHLTETFYKLRPINWHAAGTGSFYMIATPKSLQNNLKGMGDG